MASDAKSEQKGGPEVTAASDRVNNPRLRCRFYEPEFPKVEDVVIVQVNQIAEMGAYVSLLEYDGIEGMILLSELSRRRIRSINKLIRVGKNECVSVLRVDREKGYIDLSKRRVSSDELVAAQERFNKGKTVHSIMRNVAKQLDRELSELQRMITWPLARSKKWAHPHDAFVWAVQNPEQVFTSLRELQEQQLTQYRQRLEELRRIAASGPQEQLDADANSDDEEEEETMSEEHLVASIAALEEGLELPEDIKTTLLQHIRRRLTPQPIKIRADIDVSCYNYEGIDAVKAALAEAKAFSKPNMPLTITLIAPPQYVLQTSSLDKNEGIQRARDAVEAVRAKIKEKGGQLVVRMEPRATTARDDERLEELMNKMEAENNEIDGDED